MELPKSQGGNAYKLISADGHYVEPGDLFTSRISSKFHDRLPRMQRFEDGDAWIGGPWKQPFPFGWFSCAGRAPNEMSGWMNWEDVRPGGYDAKARLVEMDEDGIDAEVLFPGISWQPIVAEKDPELHLLMVRAYNDWIMEFSSAAPDRLGIMPWIPNRGVADAVAEINRVKDHPGVAGFLMYCYPHGNLEIWPEDDAVWDLVQSTGRPLTIHVGLTDSARPQSTGTTKEIAKMLPGSGHMYDAPKRMLQFISQGVLDRFPNLNIFLAEVDCGWMPYFEDQADDNFMRHAKADLRGHSYKMLPSEYMKKHFSASFITDFVAIELRERIGVHRMLWSNDYPHITSDWPYSWRTINATFANVPPAEREQILCGNAQRLFGFGQKR